MTRVLLLARHFPPLGGAGVHRTLGSVRHLPEHGYEVMVITGPGERRDRWDACDPELLARVPEGTHVHRVPGLEPAPRTGVRARLDRLHHAPPPWIRWWVEQSTRVGLRAGVDADLVVASCLPYETALAGARLAEALGIPWVADLEDPWALDEMRLYPSGVHRALDRRRMRDALSTASAVLVTAPEAARRFENAMPELRGRVRSIPIGFERDDFARAATPSRPDSGVLRIVHTGSLHTDFGVRLRKTRRLRRIVGGTVPGVDILPRSHVFVVEAIASLIGTDPSLAGRVELHLAGELTPGDRVVAERHDFVHDRGLLSHDETIALLRSADLLFLPMHDLPVGQRAGLIPYKTYEYLAAERPILAAVPDGDVRDMLAPLDHVSLVRPTDVAGMAAAIAEAMARGHVDRVRHGIDSHALRGLERRQSVAGIAAALDEVLAASAPAAHLAA